MGLLLERSIFSQYLGELQKVSLYLEDEQTYIGPDEILSTPTHFTHADVIIPLDTTQRTVWLLHDPENGDRDRYLQGLLKAARAAAARSAENLQLVTSATPEAEVGVSA